MAPTPGIGSLKETSLHAALKDWAGKPGDRFEFPIDGYLIDIVRDDLLIEIQTRNFSMIKAKLERLLENHKVHLIHPIAQEKWIIKTIRRTTGRSVDGDRLAKAVWRTYSVSWCAFRTLYN